MSILAISTMSPPHKPRTTFTLPLNIILQLNHLLKKSIFSRNFYQEINDKVLSKSSTVDQNLYFLCYFALLVSSILNNKYNILNFLNKQKYNLLQLLKKFAKTININTSDVKAFNVNPPQPIPESEQKPSKLAFHLKKINSYLADVRIFNRLTDSIKYMPWLIDEWHGFNNPNAKSPRLDRFINVIQALNCIVLELFENVGWLTDHDWIGTGDNAYWCIETYIWCCRVWGAYLLIEIIEIIRRAPISEWKTKSWQINLFKNVIQLPLVLHWCLRDGCLTPFWVGLCGCGASWWNFKDMWSSINLK
ncbi:hypothetical protein KGF54_001545 [Candida jiufengensis]|uniref:uncharacterized protein n=1 Tax=Candida jiufengensis TaxID=497108 RepID=UPI00222445BE|nr:uncharacterized protein KGF54_001545 [Candida jiufengensis]KAI5954984.1 hypothetical protein KGF54_001545 [Candida jiufengensis]